MSEPIFTDKGLGKSTLSLLRTEALLQQEKWGKQAHTMEKWYVILQEECGELAKAILECKLEDVWVEAVQVATVAAKIATMASGGG